MVKSLINIFFILSFISCATEDKAYNFPDFKKTPVLFIHGHGMNSDSWGKMISKFIIKGYPKEYLFAFDIVPNTSGNVVAAEKQISPAIESFIDSVNNFLKIQNKKNFEKTKIDIISFSMGALSARWYAAKINPERVRTLITIGGANHGTNVLCKWADDGSKDCCPAFAESVAKSSIQYELNGEPLKPDFDETPYGIGKDSKGVNTISGNGDKKILYVSIRSEIDPWIKPENSAILDGAGIIKINNLYHYKLVETSEGNYLYKKFHGHEEMLQEDNIINFLYLILNCNDQIALK